jgi:ABC-2 type transport system ATP-binding protein
MVGFSYGGGIQLTTASIDCRVDAIVPGIAWHSLETSLYKNETVKQGWSSVLVNVATQGNLDPHIVSASQSGAATGTLSDADEAWFIDRGPAELVDEIEVPTLFVQGTVDTLFTLDEAITNHASLVKRGVPTAMLFFCGGHGVCLTDPGDVQRVTESSFAWLDRYLKGDTSAPVVPPFETLDQDGKSWTADAYPEADAEIEGHGEGTLALEDSSAAGPIEIPSANADLLGGLVAPITPGPADEAVEVAIDPGDVEGLALGAPKLTVSYSGTIGEGEEPVRAFAQLVDDENDVVVGNQITPVPLVLDGKTHTATIDLEVVSQQVVLGRTLTLQLVATTVAYAVPRLGGKVTFDKIDITVPVVTKGLAAGDAAAKQ